MQRWEKIGVIMGLGYRTGKKVYLTFRTKKQAGDFMSWLNVTVKKKKQGSETSRLIRMKCPNCGSSKLKEDDASGTIVCSKCGQKTDTYEALKKGSKPTQKLTQPSDDGLDSGE